MNNRKIAHSGDILKLERFAFATSLFLTLSIVMSPLSAQAGLFSFVSEFISNKSTETYVRGEGASNMTLLAASLSPSRDIGGGDIAIVDGDSLLPESGPVISGNVTGTQSDQISVYVVRPGDSLSQIAKMFNVSINTIVWANDLSGSTISPGQTLAILPVSGIKYQVKKGDTLQSIAKDHKGDLQEILDFNDLTTSSKIAVGDVIIIPDGEVTHTVSASSAPKATTSSINASEYFIVPLSKYTRTQGVHGYNGVDLAAPVGTPIVAAASGTVVISRNSGYNGGYGQYVVIKHGNGTQTLYAHMSEVIVYAGASVVQGQVIGYVGNTGKSTGPHLHVEVRGAKNPF